MCLGAAFDAPSSASRSFWSVSWLLKGPYAAHSTMACSRFRITVSGFWSGSSQLVVGYEALGAWAATAAPCAAVVQLPDDMTLRAAVRVHKPARPTRLRDTIVRELPGRHVLVQRLPGSDDSALLNEIANLVDSAGGIAFVPDRTPTAAVEPADSHRLRVRGVSLDALLHARGRLAAEQRAVGVLRPLPRWASFGVVAARMPEPAWRTRLARILRHGPRHHRWRYGHD